MADSFIRKLLILQMLPREEDGGITVEEIQRRLWKDHGIDVIDRNIQRDLRALQGGDEHGGFPISCDEEAPKPWRWSWYGRELLGIPKMGGHTALTLQMVRALLQPMLPAETLTHLQPNFDAAEETLKKASAKRTRRWRNKVRVIPQSLRLIPPALGPGILNTVSQALLDDRQIELTYLAASNTTGQPKTYPVHPYALLHRSSTIELLGRIDRDSKTRRWPLHRVKSAQALPSTASVPRSFNLDDYIQRELGFPESGREIRLEAWFDKSAANHVLETTLSTDQTVDERDDGLIVSATLHETVELKWWLLGLGDRVKVLKPASLRDAISSTANRMVDLYR